MASVLQISSDLPQAKVRCVRDYYTWHVVAHRPATSGSGWGPHQMLPFASADGMQDKLIRNPEAHSCVQSCAGDVGAGV